MKKVAVLGISGFSGRHFAQWLIDAKLTSSYEIYGLARDATTAAASYRFHYFAGDACSESAVSSFLKEVSPSHIINFVGVFKANTFADLLAANVSVSRTICETVVSAGLNPEKILLIGSAAEYGAPAYNPVTERFPTRPITPYGLSKLYQTILAQYYFQNYALPVVVARPFNLIGQGMSPLLAIGSFTRQIDALPEDGTIEVGNLATSRDFVSVDEAVQQYWRLLIAGAPGEVYNVCSGVPRTMRSVLDDLIVRSGKRLRVETVPTLIKPADVDIIYGDPTKYKSLNG
jgi:GDP-4-dehydro-6-deoxy-D-mannose reductase